MIDGVGADRDLSVLVVPRVGAVEAGSDAWVPVRLIDGDGEPVVPVMAFLQELQAAGPSAPTQRSYAMDLLRWFRFGWAIDVGWDQATRVEARDFCRWLALRDKPTKSGLSAGRRRVAPNAVTGKPGPGPKYAASTRAHSETVLRVFYDFHRDAGTSRSAAELPRRRRVAVPSLRYRHPGRAVGAPRGQASRTPGSRTASAAPRASACVGCHRDSSRSTPHGSSSP